MPNLPLLRLRPYVRPYLGQLALVLVAALMALAAASAIPLVTKAVVNQALAHRDRAELVTLAELAAGLGLAEGVLSFLRRFAAAKAATGIETALRNDFYAHLQRLGPGFHNRWQSGQLLSRAMTDITLIRRFVGFGAIFLVANVATFAAVMVLLLRLDVPLGILAGASLLPLAAISYSFSKRYHLVSRRVQDNQGEVATVVEEAATGIRITKAFGRQDLVRRRFGTSATELYRAGLDKVTLRSRFYAWLGLMPNIAVGLVVVAGSWSVAEGRLSVGSLVAFISLLLMLVWPVESLGEILAMGQEAATAAERVFEVLDVTPAVTDSPGARVLARSQGHITFDGVGFSYPGGGAPVLSGLSLEIEPGETVAIVGSTGSGKTTLVQLLPRLYDVTAGRVLLDGHDVRDLTIASLRSHVGIAFEDAMLFSASVRENLIVGKATATDDELAWALEICQAGFVHELPYGLGTRVGEQGLSLSGGQRQRLALARAIVGQPSALLLDDALSALDVHTEARLWAALSPLLAERSTLIVANRASTLRLADRVAFLRSGRVLATGTHSRLLATVPEYRELVSGTPARSSTGELEASA
ncbi:MAG: ABC transporter ATP-binding protein [Acidimicrobiales bacterium]